MSKYIQASRTGVLVLTLEKTEVGKYPQAKIFTTTESLVSTVNLSEVSTVSYAGLYRGTFTAPSTIGDYSILYTVYTDTGRSIVDTTQDYFPSEPMYVTSATTSPTGQGAYSHTDTIIDETTSLPVDGANIYIYSDSTRLNLIAGTTTTSTGVYEDTLYAETAGTYYRRIVAKGRPVFEDTVTFA